MLVPEQKERRVDELSRIRRKMLGMQYSLLYCIGEDTQGKYKTEEVDTITDNA